MTRPVRVSWTGTSYGTDPHAIVDMISPGFSHLARAVRSTRRSTEYERICKWAQSMRLRSGDHRQFRKRRRSSGADREFFICAPVRVAVAIRDAAHIDGYLRAKPVVPA